MFLVTSTLQWRVFRAIHCLGEEPYKHIPPRQVVAQVGRGYRMPQPSQCSDEL